MKKIMLMTKRIFTRLKKAKRERCFKCNVRLEVGTQVFVSNGKTGGKTKYYDIECAKSVNMF